MVSRTASISLPWADGKHTFRLGVGELEELQEKCDAGPPVILQRLMSGWKTWDVDQTIRLGLIGAGMKATEAYQLMVRYVHNRPEWYENAKIAQGILGAALFGVPEEPVGKSAARGGKGKSGAKSRRSRTANGGSPTTTATPSSPPRARSAPKPSDA